MAETAKQYELAYHISPTLDEAGVLRVRDEIAQMVVSSGGTITFTREPEKTRLSYPVKHQRQSWFGYLHFDLESGEKLPELDEHMRLNDGILRYLLIVRDPKMQTQAAMRVPSALRPAKQSIPRRAETPSETTPQELEEQLEKVIEKL